LRRGQDGDVVVAEVRETSRKPDEMYGVLERMVPFGRKLGEWISCANPANDGVEWSPP
jgi:N6-adenosine-specific RNA methylase IME4